MGLIRKVASVSSLGVVKYHSNAQLKGISAKQQGKAAKKDVKTTKRLADIEAGRAAAYQAQAAATYRQPRHGSALASVVLLMAVACTAQGQKAADSTVPSQATSSGAVPTDIMELEYFAPLEPGTYSIDPDVDPSTPLRVVYEIPAEGWSMWIGAVKFTDDGHAGVSITTVSNLVRQGCRDHSWADPPVGASVDDLAAALADLAPFRVTSPPEDVSIYGYRGTYLELTVPNLPVEREGDDRRFTGCMDGKLMSWVAAIDTEPGDAFYGYAGPGFTEEFWILDVEGTRLMIETGRSPGSPPEDLAELRAILDSIRIEP